jgi:hypothetical protein
MEGHMEANNPVGMVGMRDMGLSQNTELLYSSAILDKSQLQNSYISEKEKREIIKKTSEYQLSNTINDFIREYDTIFGYRNHFLWKFLGYVFTKTGVTLSSVDSQYYDIISDCKMISAILCALIDDVAEKDKDNVLLNDIRKILTNNQEDVKVTSEKTRYVSKLWNTLLENLEKLPGYKNYIDVFFFDVKQFLNTFDYSLLLNNNDAILNVKEMEIYECHNMIVYLLNGIDIMASKDLAIQDLPFLRKAFWYAQQMARIGNWISTWKREVFEGDMSSAVMAYALSNKIVKGEDIGVKSSEEIISIIEKSGVYDYFMGKWKENYEKLVSLKENIISVDMGQYVHGLENVIKYHIASEGLK